MICTPREEFSGQRIESGYRRPSPCRNLRHPAAPLDCSIRQHFQPRTRLDSGLLRRRFGRVPCRAYPTNSPARCGLGTAVSARASSWPGAVRFSSIVGRDGRQSLVWTGGPSSAVHGQRAPASVVDARIAQHSSAFAGPWSGGVALQRAGAGGDAVWECCIASVL